MTIWGLKKLNLHENVQLQKPVRQWLADCAEASLPFYEQAHPDDSRPAAAIEAVRQYARGQLTAAACYQAGTAAWTAAMTASTPAARAAGHAAAGAAKYFTYDPEHAARDASDSASAAVEYAGGDREETIAWQVKKLKERLEAADQD